MRKNQYRFVMVYCKLKNNGYGICDTMADCRKCGLELKVGDEIYSLPRGSGMVRYHKKCYENTQYVKRRIKKEEAISG